MLLAISFAPAQSLESFNKCDIKAALIIFAITILAFLGWLFYAYEKGGRAPSERQMIMRLIRTVASIGATGSGGPVILGFAAQASQKSGICNVSFSLQSVDTSCAVSLFFTLAALLFLSIRYRTARR